METNDDLVIPSSARRRFPWVIVAIIAGVLIVLGLAAGGVWLAAPCVIDTPERTLDSYYSAFNEMDIPRLTTFYTGTSVTQALPLLDDLKDRAETGLKVIAPNFKLAWELQDRQYEVLEKATDHQCASARIRVTGRLYVHDQGSNLGVTLGYDVTHQMIRRDGHWYLQL
jgi:hypothetical protein